MTAIEVSTDYACATHRLLYGMKRRGMALEPVLEAAGVDPAFLSDPYYKIRGRAYLRLLRAVKDACKDEFYGLTERPCKIGTFAMMASTGLHCETLQSFIEHCCQFYYLVTDDLQLHLHTDGDNARYSVVQTRLDLDPEQFLSEYWLLHFHRMFSWVTGLMLPLQEVAFTSTEPSGPERLLYYVRKDWKANQSTNSIAFHSKYLSLPVVRTQSELQAHLSPAADQVPTWPDDVMTWSARVKARLKAAFDQQIPPEDINQIASALFTTSRSLRRHLRDEGTTYQTLLDDLRRDIAIEKLHFQHLSVADVAGLLGFSEPRSFSRAFKQWTGTSPGRYQHKNPERIASAGK